jgi:hypothetical protein
VQSPKANLEVAGDGVELPANLRAEGGNGANDHDGDQACDETIFDRSRAGVILEKFLDKRYRVSPEFAQFSFAFMQISASCMKVEPAQGGLR